MTAPTPRQLADGPQVADLTRYFALEGNHTRVFWVSDLPTSPDEPIRVQAHVGRPVAELEA